MHKLQASVLLIVLFILSCNKKEDVTIDPYLRFTNTSSELVQLNGCGENNLSSFNHVLTYESDRSIEVSKIKFIITWEDGGEAEREIFDFDNIFVVEKEDSNGDPLNKVERGEISYVWCYGFGSNNFLNIEYEIFTDHTVDPEGELSLRINKPFNAN
jgi:hypothetical protein